MQVSASVYLKRRLEKIRHDAYSFFKNLKLILGLKHRSHKEHQIQRHKKLRAFFVAVFIPSIFAALKLSLLSDVDKLWVWLIVAVSMAIIVYFLTLWVLYFQVLLSTALGVVLLPAVFTFVYLWFLGYFFIVPLNRMLLIGIFIILLLLYSIAMYIALLTTNLLNVNKFFRIPLALLAETFLVVFKVLEIAIWSFVLYKYIADIATIDFAKVSYRIFYLFIALFWYFVVIAIFWIFFKYFIMDSKKALFLSAAFGLLFYLSAIFILLVVPNGYKLALLMAFWTYAVLSYMVHNYHRTLAQGVYIELLVVAIISAYLLFF